MNAQVSFGLLWQKRGTETHCKNGHPKTEENTYVYKNKRYCKPCRRTNKRRNYARCTGKLPKFESKKQSLEEKKASHVRVSTNHYNENKRWADEYKLSRGCIDCGFNKWPEALDFDHRNKEEKVFLISCGMRLSRSRLEAEASKCDIRCANCHRHKSRLIAIGLAKRRKPKAVGPMSKLIRASSRSLPFLAQGNFPPILLSD